MADSQFHALPLHSPPPATTAHSRRLVVAASAAANLSPLASGGPPPRRPQSSVLQSLSSNSDTSYGGPGPRSAHGTASSASTAQIYNNRQHDGNTQQLDAASFGVLTGAIGGSYSPFPRSSTYASASLGQAPPPFSFRDSVSSSDVAIDLSSDSPPTLPYRDSTASNSDGSLSREHQGGHLAQRHVPNAALLWDKENSEADDYLHDPDAVLDRMLDKQWAHFSFRGFCNVAILALLVGALVGAFMGWPVWQSIADARQATAGRSLSLGWGLGGINATGQVPNIPGLPLMVDIATPQSALQRVGFDGETYNLVFSDEFNVDNRSFWPGDDPWWEASDFHYWATNDLEWYDPDAITTVDGKLKITLTEEPSHGLNFRSGFLSSWNKLCFTGGYIEVSMSLPGTAHAMGFWPAAWTMGNLARAGYGASAYGTWPYSYSACDVGTLPNQTMPDGLTPAAAKNSGSQDYGGELSYLPGQKFSSCTCPGEDHPGPNVQTGRGAPEIDIIEGQVDYRGFGSASQSIQVAPIDAGYEWKNTTPYINIWNETGTFQNDWHGSVNQESMSVITLLDATSYEGTSYQSFGFEYDPGPNGRITWAVNAQPTWELTASAIGPNTPAAISQRLISQEPMAININLAISNAFQTPEWSKLVFPGHLLVDYVRVYQKGTPNVGCNPASHPTTDYIARHPEAYTNYNLTTWDEVPNSTWPKNSMSANGCN